MGRDSCERWRNLWFGLLLKIFVVKKTLVCMWKAMFRCLLVDKRNQNHGVCLAFKCDKWAQPKEEATDHILCICEVTEYIWVIATNSLKVECMHSRAWWAKVSQWNTCIGNWRWGAHDRNFVESNYKLHLYRSYRVIKWFLKNRYYSDRENIFIISMFNRCS